MITENSLESLILQKIKPSETQLKKRKRIDEAEIITQEDYVEKLKSKNVEMKPKKKTKIKIENIENEEIPPKSGKKRGRKPKVRK